MKIAILGCGWLGFPLAKALIKHGYQVHGSTTSPGKTEELASAGIRPFLVRLGEGGIEGNMKSFLKNMETVIVNIPPKLRGTTPESFVKKTEHLIPVLENSGIRHVLFISSTAIYPDDNSTITEETLPRPETESGKQLLASETLLQSCPAFRTTILRFGGLIGPDRHPVHHLAGKKGLKNPDAPVNLIHLDDCIRIIPEIIRQQKWGKVYNAVFPSHPKRKVYYTEKAGELGLVPPQFVALSGSKGKIISPEKLRKELGYTFKGFI
ncbi:SDR family oxidoreductase [Sinomicrobium weinanense]|uniref:SDR family oxidoreductase n=1 Tax=Sinomicrobium weinanense TaxID=2842200 RepID=A0A926Q3V1_9FLAO|nr:SDR family oxidoreductase [Sinomicrobium weinanense]MBC9797962.1 SDR family oxidoreductase [Sinomicrobium weinanense]MBU3123102.1 SDR family oxidoreductase [Sinomicrobium weinanense]